MFEKKIEIGGILQLSEFDYLTNEDFSYDFFLFHPWNNLKVKFFKITSVVSDLNPLFAIQN